MDAGLVRMIAGQRKVHRVHRARFQLPHGAVRRRIVRAVTQNVLVVVFGRDDVVLMADDHVIVAGQVLGFGEVAAVVTDQDLVLRAAGQVVL